MTTNEATEPEPAPKATAETGTETAEVTDGSIATAWKSYLEAVVPAHASHVQVTQTRRAFYAGAHGLLCLLAKELDYSSPSLTDVDAQKLNAWLAELVAFSKAVEDGFA